MSGIWSEKPCSYIVLQNFAVYSYPFAFPCEFYHHLYIRILVPKQAKTKPKISWFVFIGLALDLYLLLGHPYNIKSSLNMV